MELGLPYIFKEMFEMKGEGHRKFIKCKQIKCHKFNGENPMWPVGYKDICKKMIPQNK